MAALIADLTITIVAVFCDVFFFSENEYIFCHALFAITLIQSSRLFSLSREARQIYFKLLLLREEKEQR